MLEKLLIASALACPMLVAQTPPCISLNDTNPTVGASVSTYSFAGPNVTAYQFSPNNVLLLQAAEIFGGNTAISPGSGYMTLEVYDESAAGLPDTRLGGGTWQVQTALGIDWQGASFDSIVVVSPGQNYWLVWREVGGSRLPYEPGGVTVPTMRFTGSSWVAQASQAIKWRGYCSLLDGQSALPIGLGCLSSTSKVPGEFTNYEPTVGNADFQLEASGLPAGSIGLVVFGMDPSWSSIPIPGTAGCQLHTDALVLATVPVGTGNQQAQHTTGASGHAFFDFPIPANPTLAGVVIGSQFAAFDAGLTGGLPFVFSNGLRFTIY